MRSGYIKIHKQMLEWEWWSDINTTRLWLYLLLAANSEDKNWQGVPVLRGQLITSRTHLVEATGLSEREIRTCLTRLISTSEITIKTTNKYTIVTICKYDDYQLTEKAERPAERPAERQTNDQQSTTTEYIYKETISISNDIAIGKKENAGKPARSLEERKADFYNSLIPFVATYGKDMVRAFYNYWVQVNPNGKKMLWEKQKAFELSRRLRTWYEKENVRQPQTSSQNTESRKHYDSDVTIYTDGEI